MPILWFEQHVKVNEAVSAEIRQVLEIPFAGQLSGLIFLGIGLLIILFSTLKAAVVRCCMNSYQVKNEMAMEPIKVEILNEKPENAPLIQDKSILANVDNEVKEFSVAMVAWETKQIVKYLFCKCMLHSYQK